MQAIHVQKHSFLLLGSLNYVGTVYKGQGGFYDFRVIFSAHNQSILEMMYRLKESRNHKRATGSVGWPDHIFST